MNDKDWSEAHLEVGSVEANGRATFRVTIFDIEDEPFDLPCAAVAHTRYGGEHVMFRAVGAAVKAAPNAKRIGDVLGWEDKQDAERAAKAASKVFKAEKQGATR